MFLVEWTLVQFFPVLSEVEHSYLPELSCSWAYWIVPSLFQTHFPFWKDHFVFCYCFLECCSPLSFMSFANLLSALYSIPESMNGSTGIRIVPDSLKPHLRHPPVCQRTANQCLLGQICNNAWTLLNSNGMCWAYLSSKLWNMIHFSTWTWTKTVIKKSLISLKLNWFKLLIFFPEVEVNLNHSRQLCPAQTGIKWKGFSCKLIQTEV